MLVVIKGAGDIASGIALRLFHSGFNIIMTEIAQPTTVRRTVAFSSAVFNGRAKVEDAEAILAGSTIKECPPKECSSVLKKAVEITAAGKIAVIIDPEALSVRELKPDAVIDAVLAKENTGTTMDEAPVVIGIGPGFNAGTDCHAVIETKRGHTLGRAIYSGKAIDDTGVPGNVGGYTIERLLKAPCSGVFYSNSKIGDSVKKGDTVGFVETEDSRVPMNSLLDGTLRGLLADGVPVYEGMKSGDVDPRDCYEYCFTVSEKALAVGGGALEAILKLSKNQ